jgi:hypothetical protein
MEELTEEEMAATMGVFKCEENRDISEQPEATCPIVVA